MVSNKCLQLLLLFVLLNIEAHPAGAAPVKEWNLSGDLPYLERKSSFERTLRRLSEESTSSTEESTNSDIWALLFTIFGVLMIVVCYKTCKFCFNVGRRRSMEESLFSEPKYSTIITRSSSSKLPPSQKPAMIIRLNTV